MVDTPSRREKFAQVAQAAVQWIPILLVPLVFYLLTTTSALYSDVYATKASQLTLEASMLERLTTLTIRVAAIESNRFTNADGLALQDRLGQLRQNLAVLESRVNSLRIPPPEVSTALHDIKQRLDRLETFLHRQLVPVLPGETHR